MNTPSDAHDTAGRAASIVPRFAAVASDNPSADILECGDSSPLSSVWPGNGSDRTTKKRRRIATLQKIPAGRCPGAGEPRSVGAVRCAPKPTGLANRFGSHPTPLLARASLAPLADEQQREDGVQRYGRPQERPDPFAADAEVQEIESRQPVVGQHGPQGSRRGARRGRVRANRPRPATAARNRRRGPAGCPRRRFRHPTAAGRQPRARRSTPGPWSLR